MKKSILIVSALVFFGLVGHAAAQGFVPLAPIPGLTDPGTADSVARSQNLAVFFNNLYKYLIGLAAVLAIIMIIWDGLRIATNQDNVSIITDSKGRIYNAIFGLVLVLSPVLVFSIINPSILNLSINLKPLNMTSAPVQNNTQQQQTQLPTCTSIIRTNCVHRNDAVNAVAEAAYATPQPGGWCYQIALCTNSSCKAACGEGGCNYYCGNETQCSTTYSQDYAANPSGVLSSCKQY